ncbi:pheromone-regulated protein PRM4 KNAG_0G02580 [Huiozyma naganishii CBS 8797]|uniref:Uncharacterized protein n=1 Tax=Huiozyma naganishii (strain ATCC MYA-139 / BCRC 22969 / CBS 8797 / KCTC 17520 / NBRC 10181 / NCYC 3082 / Yp74L-3) TaxID=1071383 RepID=J7S828_HUIN7|nr:hypothetical protein KNAG_0G02580 [Kazachstania naganishii CBS 8797]CCK71314.1 hypothetical protein KNAG_0G02580 [Kazachstania naganishii CBS 8797]
MGKQLKVASVGNRGRRILSSALVLAGVAVFLLCTWNDYAEDIFSGEQHAGQEHASAHIAQVTELYSDARTATTTLYASTTVSAKTTSTITAAAVVDSKEAQLNSQKVDQEISAVRKEIDAQTQPTARGDRRKKKKVLATELLADDAPWDPLSTFTEVMNMSPVVLFIKSSERNSLADHVRKVLSTEYEISPGAAVVDLDKHRYGEELQNYIETQKLPGGSSQQLPYLFVNRVPVIGAGEIDSVAEFKRLHSTGALLDRFKQLAERKVLFEKIELPSNN